MPAQAKRKRKAKPKRRATKAKGRQLMTIETPAELTAKRKRFIEEYMIDLNGTQAAIRAGYAESGASTEAYRLLRDAQIATAIAGLLRDLAAATPTRLVDELSALAFSDIGKAVVWDQQTEHIGDSDGSYFGGPPEEDAEGAVTKVITSRVTVLPSETMDPRTRLAVAEVSQGAQGQLKIKMHDKVGAIDKLLRVLGMYQDKVNVSGTVTVIPELVYYGAPPKILARKNRDEAAPEAMGGDRDESD